MYTPKNIAYTLILTTVLLSTLPSTFSQSPSYAPTFAPAAAPGPTFAPAAAPGPFGDIAPPPGPDCFTILLNASDCLSYVDSGSNLTRPDPGCCPELANLVDTQPICLCQLLGNSSGFSIDTNKALALPGVCNVTTPPVSTCAYLGIPISSPSPSGAFAPSAGGDGSFGASPSPGNPGNASPSSLGSSPHLFIGLTLALFAYFF